MHQLEQPGPDGNAGGKRGDERRLEAAFGAPGVWTSPRNSGIRSLSDASEQ